MSEKSSSDVQSSNTRFDRVKDEAKAKGAPPAGPEAHVQCQTRLRVAVQARPRCMTDRQAGLALGWS